ncbi:hypothetical protein [Caballeronia glebae]|uniref:hypothetical protein n=1 Tax=Caballeronia glebae TaxID=1777143 RepID=UPI0038BAA169
MKTQCFKHQYVFLMRPGETAYLQQTADVFAFGSITVTAFLEEDVPALAARYIEVIQMATRRQARANGYDAFLDIVVRNNGHDGAIDEFVTYTSVVTP